MNKKCLQYYFDSKTYTTEQIQTSIDETKKEFANKLKIDGAKENDIKGIKSEANFVELTKLAINFADGVIQGSETINQEISDYIASKENISFLPYQSPDVYMDKFNEFYDVILDKK